jgi:hypothetical protein
MKHNLRKYHVIRESMAAGMTQVGTENTLTNLGDVYTKLLPFSWKSGSCTISCMIITGDCIVSGQEKGVSGT